MSIVDTIKDFLFIVAFYLLFIPLCKWHFVSKTVLTWCEKNLVFFDEKFLQILGWRLFEITRLFLSHRSAIFETEYVGFFFYSDWSLKFILSQNFWLIGTIKKSIGTKNWNIETYRNRLENETFRNFRSPKRQRKSLTCVLKEKKLTLMEFEKRPLK